MSITGFSILYFGHMSITSPKESSPIVSLMTVLGPYLERRKRVNADAMERGHQPG